MPGRVNEFTGEATEKIERISRNGYKKVTIPQRGEKNGTL